MMELNEQLERFSFKIVSVIICLCLFLEVNSALSTNRMYKDSVIAYKVINMQTLGIKYLQLNKVYLIFNQLIMKTIFNMKVDRYDEVKVEEEVEIFESISKALEVQQEIADSTENDEMVLISKSYQEKQTVQNLYSSVDMEVFEEIQEETVKDIKMKKDIDQKGLISSVCAGEEYVYNLTEEEKIALAKLVYVEAGIEPFEGQVAVAAVVFNRYMSEEFDDDIYSIITKKGQFASIKNVTEKTLEENPSCMEAVEAACKGWDPTRKTFANGAKYFYSPKYISEKELRSRKGILDMKIGGHVFHDSFA